jgi:SAM-dependent methyltransferase
MVVKNYWDEKHKKYAREDWILKPTIFAKFSVKFFPKTGRLLDLGAGQGQDSLFFAKKGYIVTSIDISNNALSHFRKRLQRFKKDPKIKTLIHDFSKGLPFEDSSFDIVYSHLSLHYFNRSTTRLVFREISRVLRKGGVFACLTNTLDDPEAKDGEKVEEDFFKVGEIFKRYFTTNTLGSFVKDDFQVVVLDNKGETYKDKIKSLVRLVCFKS